MLTLVDAVAPLTPFIIVPPLVVYGWMLIDDQRQGLHDTFGGVVVRSA